MKLKTGGIRSTSVLLLATIAMLLLDRPTTTAAAFTTSSIAPPAQRMPMVTVACPQQTFFHRVSRGTLIKLDAAVQDASVGDDEDNDAEIALQDLGLTPDQISTVLHRCRQSSKVRSTNNNDHNLAWLRERFTPDQTAALVLGHPPILSYDIQTNLEPTLAFYHEAFAVSVAAPTITATSATTANTTMVDPRVATFLVEAPGLLEYNVHKRLIPRLQRAQAVLLDVDLDLERIVNDDDKEDFIRAIATKTASRFDEWLLQNCDDSSTVEQSGGQDQFQAIAQQQPQRTPASYMVLSNLQSGGNIGNILRSASIFGCEECIVVGQKRHRLTGDHGSRFDLPRRHVWSHPEAQTYLHDKGVRIYGVEIMEDAKPIMRYNSSTGVVQFPFDRHYKGAAFVMGNEGDGLSAKQREICDEFLYIPQTRGGKTEGGGSASLNVACAATVILQAYCLWASYPDAERDGEKFVALSGDSENLRYRG